MYFTNITNEELQTFHKTFIGNFTIKATDTPNNPLFHTEQNTPTTYKIIPLFNTLHIHSTNKDDKIIENKVIISNLKPNTYYTFTSNPEEPTNDYIPYGEYYNISNTLTMPEFNRVIQYIRESENSEDIRLTNGVINGVYGDYSIDIEDATITDQGILITKQTVTSPGTITLTNPVYQNSTYKLTLKVFHITDVNIMEEYGEDHKVIEDLTVTLIPDTPVQIPYETLDYGYTILFPAVVNITHDKPVITGVLVNNLLLETSKGTIQVQEPVRITATVTDIGDVGIPGKTVTFNVEKLDGTLVTTLTGVSNSGGVAFVDYTGSGLGLLRATGECGGKTGTLTFIDSIIKDIGYTDNHNDLFGNMTIFERTSTGTNVYYENTGTTSFQTGFANFVYPTGDVCVDIDLLECTNAYIQVARYKTGASTNYRVVHLTSSGKLRFVISETGTYAYLDNTLINSWTTDTNLERISLFFRVAAGETLDCKYENLLIYPKPEGSLINLALTNTKDILSYTDNDTTTLTATVTDEYDAPVSGEPVTFKIGTTTLDTIETDTDGIAEYEYTSTGAGDITFTAECNGITQTHTIEDCLTAKLTETTITNSTGTKITSIGLDTVYNIQNTDFSLEFDGTGNGVLNIGSKSHWSSSSANYRATIGYADGKNYWSTRTSSTTEGYGSNASTSTEYHYKITREGTTVKFYVDGTLIQTRTFSSFGSYSSWSIYSIIWGSGTQKIKNIKLKTLA